MYKKLNTVFIISAILFCSLTSFANEENILKYNINSSAESSHLIEKTSYSKAYNFSGDITYTLKKCDDSYLTIEPELNIIYVSSSKNMLSSDMTEISIATSFLDIIKEAKNVNTQLIDNYSNTNNQQLQSSHRLFISLNATNDLFIPDLMPIIINWNKTYQIHPIVYIINTRIGEDDPNDIIFDFKISTIIDTANCHKLEEEQLLQFSNNSFLKKKFALNGDCKINLKNNQTEIRLLTTTGDVLFHLNSNIDDKSISANTINYTIKNQSNIRYECNKTESEKFHKKETYVLITNLNEEDNHLNNMYHLYITSPLTYLTTTLDIIDQCISLQDICNKYTIANKDLKSTTSIFASLLLKIKNYNLFIPDLIPIINAWGKKGSVHPLVKTDGISIDYNLNEVTINFNIQGRSRKSLFDNQLDIQFLLPSDTTDFMSYFKINGSCKINLQKKQRITHLFIFDKNGTPFLTSNFFDLATVNLQQTSLQLTTNNSL